MVVPVSGWGTAIIYADEVVQAAVTQITEKAEECGFDIIRIEPAAAPVVENIQPNAIMQEGNEVVVPLSNDNNDNNIDTTDSNIKLNGVNHPKGPPPPLPVSSGPPMIKVNKPATTKKGD